MMKINRTLALIVLLPALLAVQACSVNPATGQQSFTAFMSPEDEIRVGREEHPKILKQFGGAFGDKALAAYVRDLGLELAQTSEMANLPWTFTVLNDTNVNAFALPGGYVYVTRGLLALVSNEAEIAAVLSHEIGHVTARHTAQRYSTSVATSIGVQVLGVLTRSAGMAGVSDIASVGANLALKSYSREQELQSDMLGVRYMTRAGYDPTASVSFFEKLRAHQIIEAKLAGGKAADADAHDMMATHPRTADRIQQAIDLAEKNGGGALKLGGDAYLARVDGLVFGDDPEQGLVRDRVFIHPALNIRFEVPPGFKIKNLPNLVLATDDSGAVIKFAGAPTKEVREAGGLERYLTRKWSTDVSLRDVEWLDINAMPAVTGHADVQSGLKTVALRRIVIEQDKDAYWRFQFETPAGEERRLNEPLRRATYSLRAPTRAELAHAQPWRVRVVEVGPGVTVQNLVDAMAVEELKSEWFHALNGLQPGDTLKPGQKVKVVK